VFGARTVFFHVAKWRDILNQKLKIVAVVQDTFDSKRGTDALHALARLLGQQLAREYIQRNKPDKSAGAPYQQISSPCFSELAGNLARSKRVLKPPIGEMPTN
jgi:hypothetical protein